MDEKALKERIRQECAAITDHQIVALVGQARIEALVEITAMLKEMMLPALLERVAQYLQEGERPVAPEPTVVVAQKDAGQERIQKEIEAIRKQLADNERRLARQEPEKPSTAAAGPVVDGSAEDEHGLGYYVYAIVRDAAASAVQDLPQGAMDPQYPVYLLPCGPLQAVVSSVALEEFGQAQLKRHLEDMGWVEARVRNHQDVLLTLMAAGTIVPMKFCTIYRSEERVAEMVRQFQEPFLVALEYLDGKQEWSVKVYCAPEVLAKKLMQTDNETPKKAASQSAGAAYLIRKKRQDAIAEEMERFCNLEVQESHDQLVQCAQEAILLPLQKQEAPQVAELTSVPQRMLLNGAYLVAEEQLEAFQGTVHDLNAHYESYGLTYELMGPWPPYSFVTIDEKENVLHD
jgi:hypothetical protein